MILHLVVFTAGILSCNFPEEEKSNVIYSSFVQQAIQPSWESSDWYDSENVIIDGESENSENRMIIHTKWTVDSLYFFLKVEDLCLRAYQDQKDHPELYLDDMAEVLIDSRNDKDSCWSDDDYVYHVNILSTKKDDQGSNDCVTDPSWDGNARISVTLLGTVNDTIDIDTGYIVTLSVPWIELSHTPEVGLTMGVNFANGDNDGRGRQLFDWVSALPMRSPYMFGDIKLKN